MNRVARLMSILSLLGAVAGLPACQKGGPLKVDRVTPAQGITGGGEQVVILGSGFQPGKTQVEVRFGRRKAEQVVISSGAKIAVVTPPSDKGPVDVTLAFDDGSFFKIPNGFSYVVPQSADDMRKAFFSDYQKEKK